MKITVIEHTHGYGYMRKTEVRKHWNMSKASVDKRFKEIEEEIKKGRYSERSIIKDGGLIYVNYLVFSDYMNNRQKLLDSNARKQVEPFNAHAYARDLGWYR